MTNEPEELPPSAFGNTSKYQILWNTLFVLHLLAVIFSREVLSLITGIFMLKYPYDFVANQTFAVQAYRNDQGISSSNPLNRSAELIRPYKECFQNLSV